MCSSDLWLLGHWTGSIRTAEAAPASRPQLPASALTAQYAGRAVVLVGGRRVHLGAGAVRGGQGLLMVELLLVAFFLALVVGHWADSWGRDRLEWTLLLCFLSPLVGGILLLIVGRKAVGA